MSTRSEGFIITASPHIFAPTTTQRIMLAVIATLVPAGVMSVLYFGVRVLLLYAVAVVAAMATEAVVKIARGRDWRSITDGSAALSGILLVMVLPATISPLLVALASVVAIFIGKEVFGGLGSNVFNPALVGRAFLSASYPVQITNYTEAAPVFSFLGSGADATGGATPLAAARFEGVRTSSLDLFFGQIGGSIGETSTLFLLIGGIALLIMRIINWRLVLSYLGSVFVLGGIFYLIAPETYPDPVFHILSGGLVLAAFYMATDMVTSPITNTGQVIFGLGAGLIVIVIRLFGGFPEGVMYSILLMNAVTPIINRYTNTTTFGSVEAREGAEA
ncbi:MAG: RnfABCDGE type electron transport complex subunit D [Spirochaetota bacterium]